MVHPDIVDLGRMKHLGTRFRGTAKPGTTVADFLTSLHPTPAVCGVPRDEAIALIRTLEPGGRGRYGGPVGWMNGKGDGEFAVALRCGQIDGTRVLIHGGGGLVKGADIEKELRETDLKLDVMLSALDVHG